MTVPVTFTVHAAGHTTPWPQHPTLAELGELFWDRRGEMTTYRLQIHAGSQVHEWSPRVTPRVAGRDIANLLSNIAARLDDPCARITFGGASWLISEMTAVNVTVGC
uniref:hypothetical protein n=1 Tax=Paractinoplanes polyasparticus TaxID=2856853 RepID=UPI001C85605C|nr:hypothetical protein [Actinoplanes polyasparticus]